MHVMCEPALARSLASEYVYVMTSVYLSGRVDGSAKKGATMAANSEVTAKDVEAQIAEIKARMPAVYQSIQDKAEDIGKVAYSLVRRGLRGEPNCFYAFERGRVVGTPFAAQSVTDEIARYMVQFGVLHVAVWANVDSPQFKSQQESTNGQN